MEEKKYFLTTLKKHLTQILLLPPPREWVFLSGL